jgi:hypothetical protein
MSIVFNWSVVKVKVAEDNLITTVDLLVTGIEDDVSASFNYTSHLTRGDSFIPYEQLTEQQVLNWCLEPKTYTVSGTQDEIKTITVSIKDDGEAQVAEQIARQLAQKQFEPALPWA